MRGMELVASFVLKNGGLIWMVDFGLFEFRMNPAIPLKNGTC